MSGFLIQQRALGPLLLPWTLLSSSGMISLRSTEVLPFRTTETVRRSRCHQSYATACKYYKPQTRTGIINESLTRNKKKKKAESYLLLAAWSPRHLFLSFTSEFSPLDSRWMASYNIVQAKYLPKSRWSSKLFLWVMEVVIDDFCLLRLQCCIYTSLCAFPLYFFSKTCLLLRTCLFFAARYQYLYDFSSAYGSHRLNLEKPVPGNSYIWISHVSNMKSLYVNKQSV